MTATPCTFAAWLRSELTTRGWSGAELARRADGVSDSAVGHWLTGARLPRYGSSRAIAAALGVPTTLVLARVGHAAPDPAAIAPDSPRARAHALIDQLPDAALTVVVPMLAGLHDATRVRS